MEDLKNDFNILGGINVTEHNKDDEVIQRISTATGVVYSDEQLNILKHHGGMAIMAAAGSGKTTVLTHLITKRILSGEIQDTSKVICTTYSKAGADEMEERINKLLSIVGIKQRIMVKTMHALYLLILQHFGYSMKLVDNLQRTRFIKEACTKAGVKLNDEDLQTLDSLLSYQVNNLLSDKDLYNSYVYNLSTVSIEKYNQIHGWYTQLKKQANMMDFDDMQLYVYFWLCVADENTRTAVTKYIQQNWTDFYIDEAQDISRIQMAILRKMCTDSNKVVFIGDDDQCIYEWRGADPSLLINITGYYDIQKFILSTNYRCRAEIVDTAAVGIKFNNRRSMKDMTPFHSGGSIKVIDTTKHKVDGSSEAPDIYHMSKYAFMYIRKIISDGINPADIAVLSRNNNQLVILNNMLFRDGIYCSFSKDMRFTGNGMYKELKQILELAKDEYNHKLTSSLLWKVVPYFSVKSAKVLADFQEKCYMRFSDMLGYFLTECCNMQLDWKMPAGIKIPETYKARLKALARQLNSSQASNLKVMYLATVYSSSKETNIDKAKKENEYRRISNYLGLYTQVSVDFLYRTEDKQRTCIGYIEYFKTMVKDWGIEKTLRFLNVTQQYESGLITAFTEKVNMSTMHGAKGKEWSHVVLFADDNITFPCFRSFVDLQKRCTSKADIYKVIEEDRRLHYVAMTRAKNELAVVTYADNISVYTLEAFEILKGLDNNELIYDMAMTNRVRADFINKAKNKLLDINSKYHIDIDISKISEAQEIEFGTNDNKRDNDNSCGFSLDDMIGVAIDTEQPQEVENNSNVSIDNIGTTLNITSDTDDYNYTDEL